MADLTTLKQEIKTTLIQELMLSMTVDEIEDDAELFNPQGVGLDSVDALQLAVALEKHFALKISDAEVAKRVMQSVSTIAVAVQELRAHS